MCAKSSAFTSLFAIRLNSEICIPREPSPLGGKLSDVLPMPWPLCRLSNQFLESGNLAREHQRLVDQRKPFRKAGLMEGMCGARDHIYEFIVFLEKVGKASRHAMSPRLFLWSRSVLFLRGFRMSLSVLRRYNSSTYSASIDDLGRWFFSHWRRSCFRKLPTCTHSPPGCKSLSIKNRLMARSVACS